jgi:hypothetical protein
MSYTLNKTGTELDDILKFLNGTPLGADKGISIIDGQLEIRDSELIIGRDSNTEGMVVKTSPDGTTLTDVTAIAASSTGSTYQVFSGGILAGAADYFGSDSPILNMKLTTATLTDPGVFTTFPLVTEYWNGSTWVETKICVYDDANPSDQRSDQPGSVVGSEQILISDSHLQVKTTLDGDEKYYFRWRLIADIISAGTIEQIKIGTSRAEIEAPNGNSTFVGAANYSKPIFEGLNNLQNLLGATPTNENITISTDITIVGIRNGFANSVKDGKTGSFTIPEGVNTSEPLRFEVLWLPKDATAGDIELELVTSQVKTNNGALDGTLPQVLVSDITSVNNEQNILKQTVFNVDVEKLLPSESLSFSLFRDATAGNLDDTYGNTVILHKIRVVATFYRP